MEYGTHEDIQNRSEMMDRIGDNLINSWNSTLSSQHPDNASIDKKEMEHYKKKGKLEWLLEQGKKIGKEIIDDQKKNLKKIQKNI